MLKIVSLDIIDIVPTSTGISFVLRDDLPEGGTKVSFYSFNIATKQIQHMNKDDYLNAKFGKNGQTIAPQLGDYVSCDASVLWNGNSFVVYSSGEFGIFDNEGNLTKTGILSYHDEPAKDATAENNYIWAVVPSSNLIIKYSTLQDRVIMRIGGDTTTTFASPESIEIYDNDIYVCNSGSHIIKRISLSDYSVSDFKEFNEPVYKYIRVSGKEFVVLSSGVYML